MKRKLVLLIAMFFAMALAMIGCATGEFAAELVNAPLAAVGLAGENDVQERKQNEAAGRGRLTNRQVVQQWEANEKSGLGKITDAEVEKERNANESAGRGRITNQQVVQQREANEKAGLGKITDAEVEKERKENEKAGRGRVTNKQIEIAKDKQVAQPFLEKAKSYEQQKQWAYALNSYFQVLFLDIDPFAQEEAAEKYLSLADSIKSGNPGIGNFNEFALHDEWKKLLMNAEKFGTEYGRYYFSIGKLEKKGLDYATKTATYSSKITISDSLIYQKVIEVIQAGYKAAWKKDWTDLPKPDYWPNYSVTGSSQGGNFANGVAIYRSDAKNLWSSGNLEYAPAGWGVYNAFAYPYAGNCHGPMEDGWGGSLDVWIAGSLYELSFNIVDENGRELVKPKRSYIYIGSGTYRASGPYASDNSIEFKGISSALMDKISNGTARINLVGVYLKYGTYNKNRDANILPEDMVKNFKEIPVPNFRCGYAK